MNMSNPASLLTIVLITTTHHIITTCRSAFAVFFYLHMDCLDGKQARRTKNSSPLGQLFDHGALAREEDHPAGSDPAAMPCQPDVHTPAL